MIKWNDVLEVAKKCMSQDNLKIITTMESTGKPGELIRFVINLVMEAERNALNSVYNGDCDMAIFSHYKLVRDFGNIYRDYNDEKYATGS